MKYLYLALSSVVIAYVVILIFIYFYQRNLLYHPSENNYQNDIAKFNYEEIKIKVDDKIELKSWLINKDLDKYKTLLIFHGNAGNLSNRIYKLNELSKLDINILLISGEVSVETKDLQQKIIYIRMLKQVYNLA